MTDAPRCPLCNSRDASPLDHPRFSWMCSSCDHVYAGGDLEYLRMTPRRDAYLKRQREAAEAAEAAAAAGAPLAEPVPDVPQFSTNPGRR